MHDLSDSALPDGERKWKAVYTIVEPDRSKGHGKTLWVRIGTAFVNRDQSLNVRLDAMPINATMHIRDYEPRDETRGRRDDSSGAAPAAPPRRLV
jgi:hypothetical protein